LVCAYKLRFGGIFRFFIVKKQKCVENTARTCYNELLKALEEVSEYGEKRYP
jgi:hypothetical protein